MHYQRSKVVATYSKRKQFQRIIRDNWHEDISPCYNRHYNNNEDIALKPLTSTPIGKSTTVIKSPAKECKPLNLLQTGSFDTPLDDRYLLKDIDHPRQLNSKRACRRSPSNLAKSPVLSNKLQECKSVSPIAVDSQLDLFAATLSTSNSAVCESQECIISEHPLGESVRLSGNKANADLLDHFEEEAAPDSENFMEKSPSDSEHFVKGAAEHAMEGSPSDSEHFVKGAAEHAKEEAAPNSDNVDEAQLSLEISKMSIQENRSIYEVSDKNQDSLMEISIEECISEQKIAALDRSLMLTQALPSLNKLLSQCRRVRDLETMVQHESRIRKIGEGTFGEVFMGSDTVYKIVPVGGLVEINDAEQTTFENAFQEIVVSRKLSDLAGDEVQMGKAFCQLKDVIICEGKYPEVLLNAWDEFKGTENQRPDVLPSDQLYVVLLARYSGVQLEDYCREHKLTPDQAHSLIRQICCSLAAAEQKYDFEHRDLHWGNVLVSKTDMQHVEFTQNGKTFILKSHGLLATIIDFTFSRLETEGCLNFVDLEQEEWLFEGDVKVDIQYRVYRDMRSSCRKNWAKFTPKTNVLWILYLVDKINEKLKSIKLRRLKQSLQSCKSASLALPIAFRSL